MEEDMEEEASECGSGCESGWTMYLEQSQEISAPPLKEGDLRAEEEEEDLSMVSDASSGPPHLQEEDEDFYPHLSQKNGCFASGSSTSSAAAALQDRNSKRRRLETEEHRRQQVASVYLDDTASSPFLGFSSNVRRLLLHQQNCEPVVSSSFGIPGKSLLTHSNSENFAEAAVEFSYDFSATYLKGKSALQKPLHYMNPTSAKPVRRSEAGKKIW